MRFFKLTTATLVSFFCLSFIVALPERLCFKGGESYSFYCGTDSADCKVIRADLNPAKVRLSLKNVCGEGAIYTLKMPEDIINELNAEVVFYEQVGRVTSYYCRAKLPYSVKIGDEKINLQISVCGDRVAVGTPIIFGGY